MADDIQESSLSEEELDSLISDLGSKTPEPEPKGKDIPDLSQNQNIDLDSLLGTSANTVTDDELQGLTSMESSSPVSSAQFMDTTSIQRTGIPWEELYDVNVKLTVELGRTMLFIKDILLLSEGSIVELDRNVGDEVDILVNDKLFARGKLVILDEFYGVQITQIVSPQLMVNL